MANVYLTHPLHGELYINNVAAINEAKANGWVEFTPGGAPIPPFTSADPAVLAEEQEKLDAIKHQVKSETTKLNNLKTQVKEEQAKLDAIKAQTPPPSGADISSLFSKPGT